MPLIQSDGVGTGGGGSVGMIYDANVSVQLGTNQTYTVPAGRVFRGHIQGQNNSATYALDNGYGVTAANASTSNASNPQITLGPGQQIRCTAQNITIRGVLMVNG